MRSVFITLLTLATLAGSAQSQVSFSENITTQTILELKLPFATEILLESWAKTEVMVEVSVFINDGEDNDLFKLDKEVSTEVIRFEMDMNPFEQADRSWRRNCNFEIEITYKVFYPKTMELDAETIDGTFVLKSSPTLARLKTISGDIDISVLDGLLFHAKTISGEIYTDLDIQIPNKDGLRQLVGMDVRGTVGNGGKEYILETISGNIYLRKSAG